jgi:restriction system protein
MARRRKKQEDPVGQIVSGMGVLVFLYVFSQSGSLEGAGIAAGIVVGVFLAIIFMIHQIKADRLKRSGIHEIDRMDGIQFEKYLGLLFRSQGYNAVVTQASGDFGADLVLEKGGQKIVVQAKRYSKNVGIDAVQQVVASMAHYKAAVAWVVTNRDYTDAAYQLASSNGVRLVNREQLIEMILKMNPNAVPHPKRVMAEASASQQKKTVCEKCGKAMVLRKGKNGDFYGCSGFPNCRNTKPISNMSNRKTS